MAQPFKKDTKVDFNFHLGRSSKYYFFFSLSRGENHTESFKGS